MLERYSRQTPLEEIGVEGQEKLAEKSVAIVGLGALGSVSAELLARAGVGKLLLIDRDVVEESNLPRQFLYAEEDIGKSKAQAAKQRLEKINSRCQLQAEAIHLHKSLLTILKNANIVLDCTDNLATRFLINDYCKKEGKIWIYAAAIKTEGYVLPIFPDGPCLRCFLSEEASPETCASAGVLNTIIAGVASLQATIAIKILLGAERSRNLIHLDVWRPTFQNIALKQKADCPACHGTYPMLEVEEKFTAMPFCGSQKYQIVGKKKDLNLLQSRWEKRGPVFREESALHFGDITLFADGRALVRAPSAAAAQALYKQYMET